MGAVGFRRCGVMVGHARHGWMPDVQDLAFRVWV